MELQFIVYSSETEMIITTQAELALKPGTTDTNSNASTTKHFGEDHVRKKDQEAAATDLHLQESPSHRRQKSEAPARAFAKCSVAVSNKASACSLSWPYAENGTIHDNTAKKMNRTEILNITSKVLNGLDKSNPEMI